MVLAKPLIAMAAVAAGLAGSRSARAEECSPPEIFSPRPGQVVGDSRPVIAIAPDVARRSTRLVAEIRIPEREILQRVDTELNSDVLQLPVQATIYRANIKVALHAKCKGAAPGGGERSVNARIYVDTGLACRSPREIAQAGSQLRWVRAEGADGTEIAFLGAGDGRELRRLTTGALSLPIVEQAAGGVVAVLRSRCGGGYSAPSFFFLR